MSSLGFQLVYSLINEQETLVCERFFLPAPGEQVRSVESGRRLTDFPLVLFSISFEHDYLHLVRLLLAASIPPLAAGRPPQIAPGHPLVICGGVATFMNPEPIAPFVDLFVIGEAEVVLKDLLGFLERNIVRKERSAVLFDVVHNLSGCYAPLFYTPAYDTNGRFRGSSCKPGVPERIKKVVVTHCDKAAHSQLLTPLAEFSDLYLTELGRGCSRGCRFCAAGYIYRPPRLWDGEAVIRGLSERPPSIKRIGLLGMEMADTDSLADISRNLHESGCSLSFSSLRADRISKPLLDLLAGSDLKSAAIAPDGASERLRRVINKGLTEEDLLLAAESLARAGLNKLKLYLMIGLPTETLDDLQEMLVFVGRLKERIMPVGRSRGRLCEITLSVNCFTPKPWTPFQFHPFGISERLAPGETRPVTEALHMLKKKITFLRKGLAGETNVHFRCDSPEKVLFQAVLARGDRRLAPVLLDMAEQGIPWNQAMKNNHLQPEMFAVCGHGKDDVFPWTIVDHGINQGFLWREYLKSFRAEATKSCETGSCRLCGVCHDR
jgi:radical SAM superfamily enzyme YgiQ (UPF0313 family)